MGFGQGLTKYQPMTTPWKNKCRSAQFASQPLSDCVWRGRPAQTKTKSVGATRAGAALCLEEQLPGGALCGPEAVDCERFRFLSPSQDHLIAIVFVWGGRPCHRKSWREGLGFGEYI